MTDVEEDKSTRRRTIARVLLVLTLLLAAALLALWFARVPIASRFIDRSLAASNVPARYTIEDLGFRRQRLTNVIIGDPANPDLVADWVETRVSLGSGAPALTAVRAGQVRLRGALIDGRLSLGALDRLLPPPSGKPFALPAIDLAVDDARMRLTTPLGVIGLRLAGRGRLDDGFRGTLAAVTRDLKLGDCVARAPTALLNLSVAEAAPSIAGPVRLAALTCGDTRITHPEARVDVALSAALDRWRGSAALRAGSVSAAGVRLASLGGQIGFTGSPARTEGEAQLRGDGLASNVLTGDTLAFAGTWRVATGRALAAGRIDLHGAAATPASRARLVSLGTSAAGTPLAPLAAATGDGLAKAAARFDLGGELALGTVTGRPLATVRQLSLRAASGATASFGDGAGLVLGEAGAFRADGALRFGGGGLPAGRISLAQPRAGAPANGLAVLAPYAASGASLTLTPARFTATPAGNLRLITTATLTGPLPGGAVEALRLPLAVRAERGRVIVNPACVPASFRRLTLSGLTLGQTQTTICPIDGALLRLDGEQIGGGLRVAGLRLDGTLGGTPLTLASRGVEWRHANTRFTLADVAARIGRIGSVTRLDFTRLDGRVAGGAIAGLFHGGAAQIGNVPLLLSNAAGDWRFTNSVLSLGGTLAVADAADSPRFNPLAAREVSLRLAGNTITAQGTLYQPVKSIKVADVTIRHVLASGAGAAHLAIPGITFGDGFQPEELTRLTFGVIADVRGTIRGQGDIGWSPQGVTSTGTFGTDRTDLAAAFGPVTGIKGEVRFTDLLALESAPNQVATVAEVNPGVAVTDGRIDYQLLRDLRVKVNGGRWPFAGGTLALEPTLLDFASPQERRMTFRVDGMEARQFLQQFDFKNLDATGVFDGELPMLFDQSGGRIENGRLVVRQGGGSLAYLGELTEKDLGTWGNIAFQALRSLRYRNLQIVMNGPLAGEMITAVRFAGVSQGEGAKSNLLVRRLQRLPFVFNVRIKAPFRGLIDSAASFYDPKRLIDRNLPALLEEQNKRADPPVIQPPASEIMPGAKH
ncbi:YdbH domain-containing protein [Sphingomonas jeddahensis]|uniref:Dicarboxylate transport n=1 Tax=Sphingomonas jeddahensis TaxID=1915074 RepID=A0A1V2EXE7_9SPHN|nr:YdbH domain-containing protein [Sphingomonas jeddahensis]ONF97341.1 Dicarboxylate transport [Sphingomonas jeddahensis]